MLPCDDVQKVLLCPSDKITNIEATLGVDLENAVEEVYFVRGTNEDLEIYAYEGNLTGATRYIRDIEYPIATAGASITGDYLEVTPENYEV